MYSNNNFFISGSLVTIKLMFTIKSHVFGVPLDISAFDKKILLGMVAQ